ncbi:MAG: DUF1365 domain-containing protein [Campylobacterota bacterium]
MSNHKFYDGKVYHKRFSPKEHSFKYKFFVLDIDIDSIEKLSDNALFSYEKFNIFCFKSKDHFGKNSNFKENVEELLKKHGISDYSNLRFITLPRILNFVFNPISLLLIYDKQKNLSYLLAEVHNYNGGRVVYPIKLESRGYNLYKGEVPKDMLVSPFFKRYGEYSFLFRYDKSNVALKIDLFEQSVKVLTASFSGTPVQFNTKNTFKLFLKHTFLSFFVVIRTFFQAFKLYKKGLKFNSAEEKDKIRRF